MHRNYTVAQRTYTMFGNQIVMSMTMVAVDYMETQIMEQFIAKVVTITEEEAPTQPLKGERKD